MGKLKMHSITLTGPKVTLRPMTEQDWDMLVRWHHDDEVLYFYMIEDRPYGREQVQFFYRQDSRKASWFIIEFMDRPIGMCRLKKRNIGNSDCRRIDLVIGEKTFRDRGLGTEVIQLLTKFGFEHEKADKIFACGVADYNPRSRRVFEKNGFVLVGENRQPVNKKAKVTYDLVLTREEYEAKRQRCPEEHNE